MLGATYSKGFVPTKEDAMTTYIMLVNWTDQGIQKIKDSPRRFDVAKGAPNSEAGSTEGSQPVAIADDWYRRCRAAIAAYLAPWGAFACGAGI